VETVGRDKNCNSTAVSAGRLHFFDSSSAPPCTIEWSHRVVHSFGYTALLDRSVGFGWLKRLQTAPGCVPATRRSLHCPAMIKPRVDKLMEKTDSHYTAVVVAAKRARQLNSYYRALGEGTYEEHTPPMIEAESDNYLTIALEEFAAGKIDYEYRH